MNSQRPQAELNAATKRRNSQEHARCDMYLQARFQLCQFAALLTQEHEPLLLPQSCFLQEREKATRVRETRAKDCLRRFQRRFRRFLLLKLRDNDAVLYSM
eukprot:13641-Heterococcus_DN1.PRE.2